MNAKQSFETKRLYALIDWKLKKLGISNADYPLDSLAIAKEQKNLKIEFLSYSTTSICGTLYKSEGSSVMGLNNLRSAKGLNFDSMHELIHFWFHPTGNRLCYDDNYIKQNRFLEWQANEGAAQFLMRADLFHEKFLYYSGNIKELSNFFNLNEKAIEFRIKNLKVGEIEKKIIIEKPISLSWIPKI